MFTLHTKANRLMAPNQFNLEPANILCNDVTLPAEFGNLGGTYNPHNVRLWLIGHFHGAICAVFASNEQDALDEACNLGKLEGMQVSVDDIKECEIDPYERYTPLGNASELHDLSDAWIAEVDLNAARDIKLITQFARAYEGDHDTLDF